MLMKWQYRSMAIESRAADNRSWMHDQAQNSDWWLQPRAMMKKSIGNHPFSGWDSWSRSRGVGKNMHIVNKGNLNCGDVQYGSMDVFWDRFHIEFHEQKLTSPKLSWSLAFLPPWATQHHGDGKVPCGEIHGNLTQQERQKALEDPRQRWQSFQRFTVQYFNN